MAVNVQAMGGRRPGRGLRLVPFVHARIGAALGSLCASWGAFIPRPTAQQFWQSSHGEQVNWDAVDVSTASSLGASQRWDELGVRHTQEAHDLRKGQQSAHGEVSERLRPRSL